MSNTLSSDELRADYDRILSALEQRVDGVQQAIVRFEGSRQDVHLKSMTRDLKAIAQLIDMANSHPYRETLFQSSDGKPLEGQDLVEAMDGDPVSSVTRFWALTMLTWSLRVAVSDPGCPKLPSGALAPHLAIHSLLTRSWPWR